MDTLRIGTWNLGRSGAFHRTRIPRQLEVLQQRNADLWVLTEAHDANALPGGHRCGSVAGAKIHRKGEHRVMLWSRYPLRPVSTEDAVSTVAACLEIPALDRPLLVYGTVITHAYGGVAQRHGLPWQRYREAVQRQRAEWLRLRQEFPDHALCVAGNFNARLDSTVSYHVADAKAAVLQGLADAGLKCLTTDDLRGPPDPDEERAGMDHVCFSDIEGLHSRVHTWPGTQEGYKLSDHGGLLVELTWPPLER